MLRHDWPEEIGHTVFHISFEMIKSRIGLMGSIKRNLYQPPERILPVKISTIL